MTDAPAVDSPPEAGPAPPRRVWQWRLALAAPLVAVPLWVAFARAVPLPPALMAASVAVLAAMLATACVTDLRWRRIYNWATYSAILWAVGLQALAFVAEQLPDGAVSGLSAAGFLEPYVPGRVLFGLGIGFGLMLMLYISAGGGGGDLKLVAAVGCVLGPIRLFEALVASYIAAGVLAAAILIWRVGPVELAKFGVRKLAGPLAPMLRFLGPEPDLKDVWQIGIPMAPFYTIGVAVTLWKWPAA